MMVADDHRSVWLPLNGIPLTAWLRNKEFSKRALRVKVYVPPGANIFGRTRSVCDAAPVNVTLDELKSPMEGVTDHAKTYTGSFGPRKASLLSGSTLFTTKGSIRMSGMVSFTTVTTTWVLTVWSPSTLLTVRVNSYSAGGSR